MTKPTGLFRCLDCLNEWDGSELLENHHGHFVCGDPTCGGNVVKIADAPEQEGAMGHYFYGGEVYETNPEPNDSEIII